MAEGSYPLTSWGKFQHTGTELELTKIACCLAPPATQVEEGLTPLEKAGFGTLVICQITSPPHFPGAAPGGGPDDRHLDESITRLIILLIIGVLWAELCQVPHLELVCLRWC